MTTTTERTGLWLVGAGGSVAATVAAGLAALRAGVAHPHRPRHRPARPRRPPTSSTPPTSSPVVTTSPASPSPSAPRPSPPRASSPTTCPRLVAHDLDEASTRVRPGYTVGAEGQRDAVERLAADLRDFRDAARAWPGSSSSTSPPPRRPSSTTPPTPTARPRARPGTPASRRCRRARCTPPPPSRAGCAFVDFTPSAGARLPVARGDGARGRDAVGRQRRQDRRDAAQVGARADVRDALARRALLGGHQPARRGRRRDPRRPPTPAGARSTARRAGLEALLGHEVEGPLHIDHVADLGDWKTAWDHVTFAGFLGTRMTLQFTWQGCDSALAAPLVIDLARLLDLAMRRGESGPARRPRLLLQGPRRARRARPRPAARPPRPVGDGGCGRPPMTRLRDLAELVRAPGGAVRARRHPGGRRQRGVAGRSPHGAAAAGRRCRSTGRGWRSTTGPTATWTPWSGPSGRSRRGGSRRAPRSRSPPG